MLIAAQLGTNWQTVSTKIVALILMISSPLEAALARFRWYPLHVPCRTTFTANTTSSHQYFVSRLQYGTVQLSLKATGGAPHTLLRALELELYSRDTTQ